MNILITGGAGFIGSNFVRFLLAQGALSPGVTVERLVNLDLLTYAGNLENLDDIKADPRHVFVEGSIADGPLVRSLLHTHRIDVIVNLAAESHVDRSIDSPANFIATNVVGTHCLLDGFRHYLGDTTGGKGTAAAEARCRKLFVQVSTDEVFGSLAPDERPFTEETAYAPNSPYSASKAAADHLVRAYGKTYGLPVVTTNCSNNYGPCQFPEKLIPLMIRKLMKGERLPVYGDGLQVRDWIHVTDHCRGLALALTRGCPGETYLIGSRCPLTNLDVVRGVIEAVRKEAPDLVRGRGADLVAHVEDRPGHDRRYVIDPSKIEKAWGWKPEVDFETGLAETVRWYLGHIDWVERVEDGSYRGERLGLPS